MSFVPSPGNKAFSRKIVPESNSSEAQPSNGYRSDPLEKLQRNPARSSGCGFPWLPGIFGTLHPEAPRPAARRLRAGAHTHLSKNRALGPAGPGSEGAGALSAAFSLLTRLPAKRRCSPTLPAPRIPPRSAHSAVPLRAGLRWSPRPRPRPRKPQPHLAPGKWAEVVGSPRAPAASASTAPAGAPGHPATRTRPGEGSR